MKETLKIPGAAKVSVRMYCQGFGDCFLLRFGGEYVLIDCGLVLNARDERARMVEIVESIRSATGGKLARLIVTHEHYDHVSGFNHAAELWKTFEIGALWLPWTEDPDDPLARALNRYKAQAAAALEKAFAAMRPGAAFDRMDTLMAMLPARAGKYSDSTGTALARVRKMAREQGAKVAFLRPNEVLPLASGAQAIVLGPPHDEARIRDLEGERGDTFGRLALGIEEVASEFGGADPSDAGDYEEMLRRALGVDSPSIPQLSPFASFYRMERTDPRWETLEERYREGRGSSRFDAYDERWGSDEASGENDAVETMRIDRRYFDGNEAWRRIDGEQYAPVERLALQLDSFTNNVSLALAFRLPDGRVLLFPGDAQIGNWKSWGLRPFEVDGATLSIDDLLAATAVYKVGHHASHNGTYVPHFRALPKDVLCLVPFEPVSIWRSIPDENLERALREKGRVCFANAPGDLDPAFHPGPVSPTTGRAKYVDVYL